MLRALVELGCDDAFWNFLANVLRSLPSSAVHQEGIDYLVSLLSTCDFALVSTPVSRLLGELLFVCNLKDQTVQITTIPIVPLDLVVGAYVTVDDEGLAQHFRDAILKLLMSPAAIANDVLTQYLVDVLQPLLVRSVQQERRSLELLWRFVADSEEGYFISDFQLQRQLCKRPLPQTTIILQDQATKATFPLVTSHQFGEDGDVI
jgi:hypothetical protein